MDPFLFVIIFSLAHNIVSYKKRTQFVTVFVCFQVLIISFVMQISFCYLKNYLYVKTNVDIQKQANEFDLP